MFKSNSIYVFVSLSLLLLLLVLGVECKKSSVKAPTFPLIKYSQMKKYTESNNFDAVEKHFKHLIVERVSGTEEIKKVAKYITSQFNQDHWDIEFDQFTDSTPYGVKEFNNIIVTSKSPLDDPHAKTLILAAHYDSKYFKEFKFVAATDSAVSIAMIIEIAKSMESLLSTKSNKRIKILFFDGEEAFKDWTDTDSLYGSRHLATKLSTHKLTHPSTNETMSFYESVDLFVLLDLIGGANPTFHSAHPPTANLFKKMVDIEDRLSAKRIISFKSNKYFSGLSLNSEIQDDHIPFHKHSLPIMHLITVPFPSCWHKECDDINFIDGTTIEDLMKMFKVFIASYLSHNE